MRRVNWLVGFLALVVGVAVGSIGYAMATGTVNPLLTKFKGDTDAKPVSAGYNSENPTQTPNLDLSGNLSQNMNDLYPLNPNADTSPSDANNPLLGSTLTKVDPQLAQVITSDYKQDIGLFFDAWKSKDMASFRAKLAKAYTGDLYEKHARRAEEYINQGMGLEVTKITFDSIKVESATDKAATLTANYRYIAQDYNVIDSSTIGEQYEHNVNVRVNLIKINNKWLITGESLLNR